MNDPALHDLLLSYLPVSAAFIVGVLLLWLIHLLLLARHPNLGAQARLPRQLAMFVLTVMLLVMMIILFPMSDSTRGQVITLLGVVITGVIALSSTTFVANVMAVLMLTVVKSLQPGDVIRVAEKFGRVTERGLFHTEIQTEDRDLVTLPNLHLATNPVTVVHSTGTIIAAELSLGYDISRRKVEDLLKQAAQQAELQDPFVLIIELGDFSVLYRISGFLPEVKNLITAKSTLKKFVLDVLHEADVEIVSPRFMNQRQLAPEGKMIPTHESEPQVRPAQKETIPEELIFDKAQQAAEVEVLRNELDKLNTQFDELSKQKKSLSKDEQEGLQFQLDVIDEQRKRLADELDKLSAETDSEK